MEPQNDVKAAAVLPPQCMVRWGSIRPNASCEIGKGEIPPIDLVLAQPSVSACQQLHRILRHRSESSHFCFDKLSETGVPEHAVGTMPYGSCTKNTAPIHRPALYEAHILPIVALVVAPSTCAQRRRSTWLAHRSPQGIASSEPVLSAISWVRLTQDVF